MNDIRLGRISALNYELGTARVVYADRCDSVTAELPLLAAEYAMPGVDDPVLVLHLPNGGEAGVVLGRFWCEGHRPKEGGEGLWRKDIAEGVYLRHQSGGKLQLVCQEGIELVGDVNVRGGLTVENEVVAAGEVTAAGSVKLSTHTHIDSDGESTTAPR